MNNLFLKLKSEYDELSINVKTSFWFVASAFFQRGVTVITTPIFTRLMTPSEYGEFSVFYSWYGIITIIVTLNLFFGVYVRGLVKYEDEKKIFSSSMEGLVLVLIIIWLSIYLIFSKIFNECFSLSTTQILCMFLIIWSNSAFCFWAAEQRVDLNYKILITISIVAVITTPVFQIILIFFIEDKVTARIYGMTFVNAFLYIPLFVKQMKAGKVFYSKKYWMYALSFNIPLIPHYLSQTVLNSADRLMINHMIGTREAGIYSLAYSISQIMAIFNSSLMQTIEPWLYKKIRDKQVHEISKVEYPSFTLIAIVNLMLIAFAPDIIKIFAPTAYYDAIWIIPPVAMSVFFQFTYTFFAVFEFYYEKTQYITLATTGGAVLNIFLNYLFLKRYGYYAAGYTTFICFVLYAVFHYCFMVKLIKKYHPDEKVYNLKILLSIAVFFLSIGFLLLTTYSYLIIRYGVIMLMFVIFVIKKKLIIQQIRKFIDIRKTSK